MKRIPHNKRASPPKDVLEDLYLRQKLSMRKMGMQYNVTNKVIKRWLLEADVPLRSHSDTMKMTYVHGREEPDYAERQKKIIRTCREKYGRDYPFDYKIAKKTFKRKYGVDNAAKIGMNQESLEILSSPKKMIEYADKFSSRNVPLLSKYIGVHPSTFWDYVRKYDIDDEFPIIQNSSMKEIEVFDFIKTFYDGEMIRHDRKLLGNRRELDIYLPALKLAIEFNGNWWHCEVNADKYDAQKKYLGCLKKGIRLIQIYEWQWDDAGRQQATKDIIKKAIERPTQGLLCPIMHNDIGNSHAYLAAGRKFSHVTEPAFWWIKGIKVYDGEEKPDEEMLADGWNRLYNAGMTIWS